MRLDTMALMRLTLTLFNPSEPTSSSPHTPITALHGLQGGYVRCKEPMDIIRVDLKPKMKKIDLDGALSVLVSAVACVLLVVAISFVSWFSCRSGVLQRPAGWLSELQRV